MREILFAMVFVVLGMASYAVNQSNHLAKRQNHAALSPAVPGASTPVRQEAEQSAEPKGPAVEHKGFIDRTFEDPVALFTLVLTAFTGGLFIATRSLWVATKDLVSGADRTAERQLRAYLTIKLIPVNKERADAPILIRNTGLTPAASVRSHFNYQPFPPGVDLPEDFDYPDLGDMTPNSAAIIGPSEEHTFSHLIDLEYVNDVIAGKAYLYIYGRVVYNDVFIKERITQFCYLIRPSATLGRVDAVMWRAHNGFT